MNIRILKKFGRWEVGVTQFVSRPVAETLIHIRVAEVVV